MIPSCPATLFRLPLRRLLPGGTEDGAGSSEAPRHDAAEDAAASPARLLVVEDDWFIGMEIESVAQGAHYEVVEIVTTAEEAVEAALAHRPELVLMDIRLAGARDGVDAALEIRRRAGIACLFVSAHGDAAVRARAEAARPAGWLAKPFSDSQLLGAIRDALATRRSQP